MTAAEPLPLACWPLEMCRASSPSCAARIEIALFFQQSLHARPEIVLTTGWADLFGSPNNFRSPPIVNAQFCRTAHTWSLPESGRVDLTEQRRTSGGNTAAPRTLTAAAVEGGLAQA